MRNSKIIKGFDTETDSEGKIMVIANEEGAKTPINSFEDVASFLRGNGNHSAIYFTFNLRYDMQAIIKLLPTDLWMDLYHTKEIEYKDYNIFYIAKKFLSIKKGKKTVKLYDVAQYYGFKSLDWCAQKYLGEKKGSDIGWIKQVKNISIEKQHRFFTIHSKEISDYCISDARQTLKLAKLIGKSFEEAGVSFSNPMSQAKLAEKHILKEEYPRFRDEKVEEMKPAHLAFFGGMFSTLRRGYFEKLWNIDLRSAYPAVQQTLPHWWNGRFFDVDNPSHEVKYGWYLVEFDCEYIPYREPLTKETRFIVIENYYKGIKSRIQVPNPGRIIYPSGKRRQVITAIEYKWLLKNNYKVEFFGGQEWLQYPGERGKKFNEPFRWMNDFYEKRMELRREDKEDIRQFAYKILLNSSYGKTAQFKFGAGLLTNFQYASYITAETRLKMADLAIKYEGHVIEIATDGILLDVEPTGDDFGERLGQLEKKELQSGIIIGSGINQVKKMDGTFVTHARGLTDNPNFNLEEILKKNLDKDMVMVTKKRPLQLGEVLTHTKLLKFSDLNLFTDVTKRLHVQTDKKRKWDRKYKNFGELYEIQSDSVPLDITGLYE